MTPLGRIARFSRRERLARKSAAHLPEPERTAVMAALAFERAELFWPITATASLTVAFGLVAGIWGLVVRMSALWSSLGGAIIGLLIAFTICASAVLAKFEAANWTQQLKDRQAFIGVWIKIAIAIGGVGLIALAIR